MADRKITGHKGSRLSGTLGVPGDKSITHRVLILGSMARGTTFARNVPSGDDVERTLGSLSALGVTCERVGDAVSVVGLGKGRYLEPAQPLECGGSATTMRLMMGAIAGRGCRATLRGDRSLARRPMDRIILPLRRMGVECTAETDAIYPPVSIVAPDYLEPVDVHLDVASAQVKTALIFAGLNVNKGRTVISGAIGSRDHTERLVPQMGGSLVVTDGSIIVEKSDLEAIAVTIPGDPSSAAFFIAGAALLPNSMITVKSVCTNPTRTGFFEALSWMGGDVEMIEGPASGREPQGDIQVKWAPLKGIEVHKEAIPFLIDEVPLVMVLACFAEGDTTIRGISELRLKETDRIACMVEGLTRMGADLEVGDSHVRIRGGTGLTGAELDPWGDHRMSMAFTLAALAAGGDSTILNVECEAKSCPRFYDKLQGVLK